MANLLWQISFTKTLYFQDKVEKCGEMCDYCVDPGSTANKASQAKSQSSGTESYFFSHVISKSYLVRIVSKKIGRNSESLLPNHTLAGIANHFKKNI